MISFVTLLFAAPAPYGVAPAPYAPAPYAPSPYAPSPEPAGYQAVPQTYQGPPPNYVAPDYLQEVPQKYNNNYHY